MNPTFFLLIIANLCGVALFADVVCKGDGIPRAYFANEAQPVRDFIAGSPVLEFTPNMVPGRLYMAHESTIAQSQLSEGVTNYVAEVIDREDLMGQLQTLAPEVQVARRFEYCLGDNAGEFLSETNDVRAPYGDFKKVSYSKDLTSGTTQNKGLTIVLDRDIMSGPNPIERAAAKLTRRLTRNELRRATTLHTAGTTLGSKTWDATAGKDPDGDLNTAINTFADTAGIFPNLVVWGGSAWALRFASLRAQTHAGGFASSLMTPQQVAELLQLEKGMVMNARYQTKKTATSKTAVLAGFVSLSYLEPDATPEDSSAIKRFVSSNDGAARGFRVFVDESNAKFVSITVEHYSLLAATLGDLRRHLVIS